MSTADISMDYSAMLSLASEVDGISADFSQMIKNFDSLVESLDGQWEGAAQKDFAAAYGKLKPKLETIGDVLSKYSTAINKVASGEESTENQLAAKFNPFSLAF